MKLHKPQVFSPKRPPRPRRAAFTLIELLIVVAIIAILAAIAVPNFLEAQTRAKISRVRSDLRTLATAIECYYSDNTDYMPYGQWGGHTHPRYLNALSTPVAYITSADSVTDPFRAYDGQDHDGVEKPRYGYFFPYHDAVKWFINGATYQGVRLPGAYRWTLVSIGPDKVQSIEHEAPAGYYLYDPTNGSKSIGEIYRFGP